LRVHMNGNRADDLSFHGIRKAEAVWWNLSRSALLEQSLRRREGTWRRPVPSSCGPASTQAGPPTTASSCGSPEARGDPLGKDEPPFDADKYEALRARLFAYLEGRELFVQDCTWRRRSAPPPIRVITEMAWHAFFARNMFLPVHREALRRHVPNSPSSAPGLPLPPRDGRTRSEVFILIHFGARRC